MVVFRVDDKAIWEVFEVADQLCKIGAVRSAGLNATIARRMRGEIYVKKVYTCDVVGSCGSRDEIKSYFRGACSGSGRCPNQWLYCASLSSDRFGQRVLGRQVLLLRTTRHIWIITDLLGCGSIAALFQQNLNSLHASLPLVRDSSTIHENLSGPFPTDRSDDINLESEDSW